MSVQNWESQHRGGEEQEHIGSVYRQKYPQREFSIHPVDARVLLSRDLTVPHAFSVPSDKRLDEASKEELDGLCRRDSRVSD